MVTTTKSYTHQDYQVNVGQGYDGVVKIDTGFVSGTGSLLFGGRAVLTAAHLFESNSSRADVIFDTAAGRREINASQVFLHPDYDDQMNNDLAIIWLDQAAPLSADRYDLYRQTNEIGQTFDLVGYGLNGTGDEGYSQPGWFSEPDKLKANNSFEATSTDLNIRFSSLSIDPIDDALLLADFDNGSFENDALGRLLFDFDAGLGSDEGMIAPGDSGGPAFIDGQVAGIASYIISLSTTTQQPDINQTLDSSFGEIGFWQRVSYYQEWIDKTQRAQYEDAPTSPEEVERAVIEGNAGEFSFAYFFIYLRGDLNDRDTISIEYATRDATATANEDYLPVDGTLMIYPDEEYVVLPVEIIGDNKAEADETFWLDIWGPQGAQLFNQQDMISVMRTIVDDDAPSGWRGQQTALAEEIETFEQVQPTPAEQDIWA